MTKYKSIGYILSILFTIAVAITIIILVSITSCGKAYAATLPEIQPVSVSTLLYRYGIPMELEQWEIDKLTRIIACESNNNPHAQNPISSSAGYGQITLATWQQYSPFPWSMRYGKEENIITTLKIYQSRSFQPWVCQA